MVPTPCPPPAGGAQGLAGRLLASAARWATAVVDVGAEPGAAALLAAAADPGAGGGAGPGAGRRAEVVAVEADPRRFEALRAALAAAAPRARAVHAVLGGSRGVVELPAAGPGAGPASGAGRRDAPAWSRLLPPRTAPQWVVPPRTVPVRLVVGDDLGVVDPARLLVRVDAGSRTPAVLRGLAGLLDRAGGVRLLVRPAGARPAEPGAAAGADPAAAAAALLDRGLAVFALDGAGGRWARVRDPARARAPGAGDAPGYLYAVPAAGAASVVAFVHSGGLAGAERSHLEAVGHLLDAGVPVHTVLPDLGGGLADALRAGGSTVSAAPLPWWVGGDADPPAPSLRGVAEALAVVRAVDPHVVLTQTVAVPQGALAAAAAGVPHVWAVRERGDAAHGLRLPAPAREVGRAVAALSAVVVVNSAEVGEHVLGGAAPWRVVHPHPYPAGPPRPPALRAPVPGPAPAGDGPGGAEAPGRRGPLVVGVVAALNPGKGHEDVVRALALLRAAGTPACLVAVGWGAPGAAGRIRGLAGDLGVADRVALPGFAADVAAWLPLFDVVAVPSRGEAFGRVPFEAAHAGVPVVYARSGGMTEYMVEEETGLAYPPGDPGALAAQLRRLADDPGLGQALAARAQEVLGDPARAAASRDALLAAVRDAAAAAPAGADPPGGDGVPGWLAEWLRRAGWGAG